MGTQQQQRSTDQAFVTAASSVYATEVRKAINNQQDQLNQLEAAHEQLQQTLTSLEQLPTKLRHEIMVPMGKHAFFPGHLTRTNEITVHLADQYHVEVTAGHARGILERKQAAVADGISKAQQQLKALQARLELSAGAVSGADEDPEAREIRSSLAESDALLASARKAKEAAAAAGVQQPAQQAERVTTASGYSYTRPQGPSTAQRSAHDHAEDIALQEKLQYLLLREQQQELQDVLHDTPAQQQAEIDAGMDTIQEGEEDSEDSEPEDQSIGSPGGSNSSSSGQHGLTGGLGAAAALTAADRLSAVHHLQQLEAQSDSDDDEQPQQQQHQQQQVLQAQQHSPSQPPAQQQQPQPQQRLQQQQPVKPLKSALKKGFFGPSGPAGSSSSGSSSRGAQAAGSTSSSRSAQAAGSSAPPALPSKPRPAAFTGTIVERPTPTASAPVEAAGPSAAAAAAAVAAAPVHDVGSVVDRPAKAAAAAAAAAAAPGSSGSKPMSKFKMRRLGLDPDAE